MKKELITGCFLIIFLFFNFSCRKVIPVNCTAIGYVYPVRFLILDKNTGENLIEKGLYNYDSIDFFYMNDIGENKNFIKSPTYSGSKDTITIFDGIPEKSGDKNFFFYIKFNAADIDTLKLNAETKKINACRTDYISLDFYVNGKPAPKRSNSSDPYIIYK